jgi:hypothetical protein
MGETILKRIATTLLVAGLMASPMLALSPPAAAVSIGIAVNFAPPPLPMYAQPIAPGPGYIWTPGYWAWDPGYGDYYWVPGTWVMPPQIGLLWTPGWWGWSNGFYRWHAGYWGSRVGFYGGVNYGHGYFGNGYVGGYWRGRDFYYNRAVNNINVVNIRHVYVNRTVVNNVHASRVSYNGGRGGLSARPDARQRAWANQRHVRPTSVQTRQRDTAMRDPAQRFKANQGRPAVFATQHAGNFRGPHTVRASTPHNRMVAAPQRARTTAARASTPNRRMMEAPRNRQQPVRSSNPSFRQQRATAPAGERGRVQAPKRRPQLARPAEQSFRAERAAPSRERGQVRQPASRPAPVAQHSPPARGGERGRRNSGDRKHGNGRGH